MKVAVFGSTGFLGSRLIKLFSKDHNIKLIRFFDTNRNNSYKKNDKDIYINFLDEKSLAKKLNEFDSVIYLIGIYIPNFMKKHYNILYEINVNLSERVCKAAKKANVKKFIYASSSGVANCTLSQNKLCDEYALSKKKAEITLMKHADSKFIVKLIRYNAIFGEGHGGSLGSLLNNSLLGFLPCFYSNKASVNFIHIEDAIFILKYIILSKNQDSEIINGSYGKYPAHLFFNQICKFAKLKKLRLNSFIVYPIALTLNLIEHIIKKSMPLSLRKYNILNSSYYLDKTVISNQNVNFPIGMTEGLRRFVKSIK